MLKKDMALIEACPCTPINSFSATCHTVKYQFEMPLEENVSRKNTFCSNDIGESRGELRSYIGLCKALEPPAN